MGLYCTQANMLRYIPVTKNCVICILYNECNNDEFETHATYDVNNISLENITEFHTKHHSPYKMLVNLDFYKVKYA